MRLALLQLDPTDSVDGALEKGRAFCRRAKDAGANLVLFPELWSHGYRLPASEGEVGPWAASALDPHAPFISAFGALAADLDLAIGVTFLEAHRPLPRNSLVVFDRRGRDILRYSKVHTCAFASERWMTPGTDFPVAVLETREGPVTIGAMVCFDREFPEAARVLALRGAEVILVPNACDIEDNRRAQLRTRAFENMAAVALANYASVQGNGRSVAFDGRAFVFDSASGQTVSRDHTLADGGTGERVVVADIDLEALRRYRDDEVWGPKWRRPGAYGVLADPGH